NSGYVGVTAKWAIWEWGASNSARRAAKAQAEAAASEVEQVRREGVTEVATKRAELDAVANAVDGERAASGSAEEAYRVTQASVRAGVSTTTDLLDAQRELTQAKSNHARDVYEQAIARVSLERAVGSGLR